VVTTGGSTGEKVSRNTSNKTGGNGTSHRSKPEIQEKNPEMKVEPSQKPTWSYKLHRGKKAGGRPNKRKKDQKLLEGFGRRGAKEPQEN